MSGGFYFSDFLAELRSPSARIALAILVAGALGIWLVHAYGPRARHRAYARPAARAAEVAQREADRARAETRRRWYVLGEDGAW